MTNVQDIKPKALVADAGRVRAERIAALLALNGFTVAIAQDCQEAFQKAQRLQPDVLVVDAALPPGGGPALCYLLREAPATRGIPVLLHRKSTSSVANADVSDRESVEELLAQVGQLAGGCAGPRQAVGLEDAIGALATALEAREPGANLHGARVAQLASALGTSLGLSSSAIATLEAAGRLHDLGKLGIPETILFSPARLGPQERRRMEQHTIVGEAICQALGVIAEEVAQAVRHHHERWDGRGYPDGLAGERIPFTARILAVADAYDAMTRRNLYRKSLTPDQALETIRQEAGKQFDPLLALAFCRMISD